MRAFEFLIEYNQAALMRNFGDKLLAKWQAEGSPYSDQIKGESEGEVTPDDIINWIEQYDPTQNNKYVTWIVGKYAGKKGGIQRLEDIASRLQDHLERYERLSRTNKLNTEHKDINQIKTLVDLSQIVKQYEDEDASSQNEPTEITNANVEVVYNGPDYIIQIPKTFEAAKELAKDTNWCTAYPDNYNEYTSQGPLFVIKDKSSGERWQWHLETRQYMDIGDEEINTDDFIKKHKKAANKVALHCGGLKKLAMIDPLTWFHYVKEPSEKLSKIAVYMNSDLINNIKNPSEEVKMAAVKGKFGSKAIRYFENPSTALQMAAVMNDGEALEYIKNPAEEIQLLALKHKNPYSEYGVIQHIENPSEEMKMIAVKHDVAALKHIKNPSEEMKWAALKAFGHAIQYIENPSEEMQWTALKSSGFVIRHIENPSEEMKLFAVKDWHRNAGNPIQYIENPSEEMKIIAVKSGGNAITKIRDPSEEVKMAAVRAYSEAIVWIHNPSEELRQLDRTLWKDKT